MWKQGIINYNGKRYGYEIKVYDEGSEFGINGGRISKLEIRCKGEKVAHYDRGWDMEPVNGEAATVTAILMTREN